MKLDYLVVPSCTDDVIKGACVTVGDYRDAVKAAQELNAETGRAYNVWKAIGNDEAMMLATVWENGRTVGAGVWG